MSSCRILSLVLLLCVAPSVRRTLPGQDSADQQADESLVKIVLTSFNVNQQPMQVEYKIVNGSDHDVWICDGIEASRAVPVFSLDYEVFMDDDARTLVVRKRLAVPREATVVTEPIRYEGCYVRLAPGQERAGSFSLGFPVQARTVFASKGPVAAEATRLIVEIGFCDDDLPGRIRSILEIADQLKCAEPWLSDVTGEKIEFFGEYFEGLMVFNAFDGLTGFDARWQEGNDRIKIPWLGSVLKEESSLKIVVDGVLIPYAR